MTPQPGQEVKLIFHNNTVIQGIVYSWDNTQAVLKTNTDQSFLIVNHPEHDIMLTVILPAKISDATAPTIIKEKIQETLEQFLPQDLKTKRLSELHLLKIQSEKEITANKLKSHLANGLKPIKYQMPSFFTRK